MSPIPFSMLFLSEEMQKYDVNINLYKFYMLITHIKMYYTQMYHLSYRQ